MDGEEGKEGQRQLSQGEQEDEGDRLIEDWSIDTVLSYWKVYMERETRIEIEQAKVAANAIFDHFDTDRNGYLDGSEVLSLMKNLIP